MCGQSSEYNTYATPSTINPLFPGFSRYQNVSFGSQKDNKKINFFEKYRKSSKFWGFFLYFERGLGGN